MSGGGGGSGNDGSNDMLVSGLEAAMSTEKGISTHAESRVGGNQGNINDEFGSGGNVYDNSPDTEVLTAEEQNSLEVGEQLVAEQEQ